ncbi:MAG: (2Fe-2S) ferredoxin domain-containing protein [Bacteroidales bacterium]|jgi:NADP-reducing hydrogenase subunit HndB|nr:(2Fe-2S) ferredoxin domain-containing protein [Bacteroidales bacterium]
MTRIKTLADLKKMRSSLQNDIDLRQQSENPESVVQVKVGMGTCGIVSGAKETISFFNDALRKRSVPAVITQTGCMGYCHSEPTVEITLPGKEPVVFGNVTPEKADEIIEKYIKKGQLVDGLIPIAYKTINE